MDRLDYSNEQKSEHNEILPTMEPWHVEKARMALAYWVLAGIFLMFIIAIVCKSASKLEYLDVETGNQIFDICRTGLLPIITLILGYYFSKSG